jgi:hypothetical protein
MKSRSSLNGCLPRLVIYQVKSPFLSQEYYMTEKSKKEKFLFSFFKKNLKYSQRAPVSQKVSSMPYLNWSLGA